MKRFVFSIFALIISPYFQFKEPDAVDEEDDVEEEEADEGADDERFAAICVSERSSKQDEDDAQGALLMPQYNIGDFLYRQ